MGALKTQLRERLGVTERRAAMIARDQNHKVSVSLERQKCATLGMYRARWKHAGAGRHPRPDHVKASREGLIFDIRKGASIFDLDQIPTATVVLNTLSPAIMITPRIRSPMTMQAIQTSRMMPKGALLL